MENLHELKSIHELGMMTDKSYTHQYLQVYEALFEPIRTRVTNVLEIGIMRGDSHRLWRDYFPNAQIYGLDVVNACGGLENEERMSIFFRDAYNEESIDLLKDVQFDVIIDDGPHTLDSMLWAANRYARLLSPNGILVIEDIPDPRWLDLISQVVDHDIKSQMYAIDRRNAPNRFSPINDEIMFVIDKRYVRYL